MNLRDHIAKDFDKNLNLGDGHFSGTREDPVVILDDSELEAIITAVEYLRCINSALKRDWKLVAIKPHEHEKEVLVRFNLDTIVMEEDNVYKDSLSYFFKCPNFQTKSLEQTGSPFIGCDTETLFPFSMSLGWSRFTGAVENEPKSMGTTINYNARSLTLSLFVYHRNVEGIGELVTDAVKSEFMENVREVREAHPEYDLYGEVTFLTDILIQEFLSKEDFSLLALTAINGHFFKVRITAVPDGSIVEAVRDTVHSIRILAEQARTISTDLIH